MSPRRGSTPRQSDWLTVSRKVTLTLADYTVIEYYATEVSLLKFIKRNETNASDLLTVFMNLTCWDFIDSVAGLRRRK
jgi:hypothetical protein